MNISLAKNGKRITTIIVVAIIACGLGWRCWMNYRQANVLYLQVFLKSTVVGDAQLFFDRGHGFNEAGSSKNEVLGDGQFRLYRFSLPRAILYNFRFDPFPASGTMYLKDMAVVDGLGHHLRTIDLSDWRAMNQVQNLLFSKNRLMVVTEQDVSDPQIALTLNDPLKLDKIHSIFTSTLIRRFTFDLLTAFILAVLILVGIDKIKLTYLVRVHVEYHQLHEFLYLFVSLFLFYIYYKGKWKDSIAFISSYYNG